LGNQETAAMKDFSTVGATEATRRRGVTAADTAHTLGDARREGREWRCRCPLHGGRSLTLRDGEGGRVLVTCWGGCDRLDVLAELRRRKLLDEGELNYRPTRTPRRDSSARDTERTTRALYLWRAAQPIAGTPVEHYLNNRGIVLRNLLGEQSASLRFHSYCSHPSGAKLPAMVALIVREGSGAVAVHRTYLLASGSGKADVAPDKANLGPAGGGAVRFGMPREGEWFAIAEGIETALSIATACAMRVWAALSEGGIRRLVLPPEATHVAICADHDTSGVGERARSRRRNVGWPKVVA
jgi:putative DNA primase/helicase